jgi:guanosine-3',5'-bis(diphosphate) 3'-pyrophosphohydrolase
MGQMVHIIPLKGAGNDEDELDLLVQKLASYMTDDNIAAVKKAYFFAKEAHHGQFRASGEPYIIHPLAAAVTLADLKLDPSCIMAALLHDVIEDTGINKCDLQAHFGDEVACLVDGVSKLTQIEFATRSEAEAENFCKMIMAMGRDIRVILVKLADRLHNMRTISALNPAKRRAKGLETLEIYAPIAHRLGMHQLYAEFEDLGFAAVYPMRYRILKAAVEKRLQHYLSIEKQLTETIQARLQKHKVEWLTFDWRKRHLYSIYKRMHDSHLPLNFILDTLPLRIIVTDLETCYRVLGHLHNLYKPNLEHFKDYVAIPKANGYRSLHTTLLATKVSGQAVPIEVQIRSQNMHDLAQLGIAAHWQEKSETGKLDRAHLRAQAWLNHLLEMHKNTGTSQEFVDAVKNDLFPDEVYVFSPKGKIFELPKGACAVDFAYMIHSDIGNTCVAAKLDRRLAPLSTPLSNGQTVEIITAQGARPNPAWLNFVTTGKARANIRQYLKGQQHVESILLGQQLLEKSLQSLATALQDIPEKRISKILKELRYDDLDDLYEAIGLGNQMSMVVAKFLVGEIKQLTKIEQSFTMQAIQPIYIKGSAGMVVTFGECCYPIPGDPIIAALNAGHGIIVHSEQCNKIIETPGYFEQCIPACWEEPVEGEFKVELIIDVTNQRGTLAKVASCISEAEANIEDISVMEKAEQCSRINLIIAVHNRTHLARIIRRIRNLKTVLRVTRKR